MRIGQLVRAVHLSQYCPGGLGFPNPPGRSDRGEPDPRFHSAVSPSRLIRPYCPDRWGLAAAGFKLDNDLKHQLDECTHQYRMGDAPR